MRKLSPERMADIEAGLAQLPADFVARWHQAEGAAEGLRTSDGAVWKRVLNWRVARYLIGQRGRATVVETHPGIGVGSDLYRMAGMSIVSAPRYQELKLTGDYDLIDVDPSGQCWDALDVVIPHLGPKTVLMVTNGEAFMVWRNWTRRQRYPTKHYGKRMGVWARDEFVPKLTELTGLPVRFFFVHPNIVRAVLAHDELPETLWEGCPRYMWWLKRYNEQYSP